MMCAPSSWREGSCPLRQTLGQARSGGWPLDLGREVEQSAVQPSRNVGGVDVILALFRLVTFEALLGGVRDQRVLRVASRPGLKAPAARRCVLLLVLHHDCQSLLRAFHVGAV